jgi:hypothetical protein
MASPVPQRAVLRKVPSGEIAIETGADGVFLRFDCDCIDALPYCKGACCGLHGIDVTEQELVNVVTVKNDDGSKRKVTLSQLATKDDEDGPEMLRSSDGFCTCLDRSTRLCRIYKDRPATCRDFHCTRGPSVRGWRLDFCRHSSHE